jgi:symplekin
MASSSAAISVPDQIRQLNDARKLVLGDVSYYPSVVRGIVPIIGPNAAIELRRWGAEFLAEAFATPTLSNSEKETMQPYVLTTLESLIENEREDIHVLRSVVQTAASIYPLALRWMCVDPNGIYLVVTNMAKADQLSRINNGYDTTTWDKMVKIKHKILQIWDKAPPSLRICCIKFAQRVVLAQSVSSGAEMRVRNTHGFSVNVTITDSLYSMAGQWTCLLTGYPPVTNRSMPGTSRRKPLDCWTACSEPCKKTGNIMMII